MIPGPSLAAGSALDGSPSACDDLMVTTYEQALPTPGAEEHRAAVQKTLLDWWDAGHRDLPWRRTCDPYAILVSEAMLQQTQVERVIPKYLAFMERFPRLVDLAAASPADVIRMWAGLGYNRRAVNLQRMARAVVDQHGGALPTDVAALQKLPGLGPYTARAVASIAFDIPAAAVDTNVRRVLTRIFLGTDAEPGPAAVQRLADELLVADRPGDWNQALMELGARVCTAASPRCPECPARDLCAAEPHIRLVRESGARYRAPKQKPQGTFGGSTRFWRGRVIDILRVHRGDDGITAPDLGRFLRLDFTMDDLPWLHDLLAGLARDGLIEWGGEDAKARLPG